MSGEELVQSGLVIRALGLWRGGPHDYMRWERWLARTHALISFDEEM